MSITKDSPPRTLPRGESLKLKLKYLILYIVSVSFFWLAPTAFASSTIVINEFYSASSSDWVEIYNSSDAPVDLSNYILTDAANNNKVFNCIIAAHGYSTIDWSNKLNNNGDTIYLKNSDVVEDCVAYGDGTPYCSGQSSADLPAPNSSQTATRLPDGGTWQLTTDSTKDAPNDGSSKPADAVCSTPTPTPSPTPTPTLTPTPKPTSTPKPATATPVPTSTPAPTSASTPVLSTAIDNSSPKVLARTNEKPQPEVNLDIIDLTATDQSQTNPSPTPPTKPNRLTSPVFVISAAGIVLMLVGGLPLFIQEIRRRKK